MNGNAQEIFTRAFWALNNGWSDAFTFRRAALLGEEGAFRAIHGQNVETVLWFLRERGDLILDHEAFLKAVGGIEGAARKMTEGNRRQYRASVDGACLVLMHSVLDTAVLDFCRVCALVAPLDWKPLVEKRTISVGELQGKTFDDVLRLKVDDYLQALEREALPKKVNVLHSICKPKPGYSRIRGYRYDEDELVRIDNIRHEYVHGRGRRQPIEDIEPVLKYMLDTGNNLFGLVNDRYDVKLDPGVIQGDLKQPPS